MREIKFRAWDKKEKEMVEVCQINWHDPYGITISHNGSWHNDIADYELMQYTGLKDKNGKEIYEGDIFEGPYYDRPYSASKRFQERRGVVQFKPDQGYVPYPTTGKFEFRFFPTWNECEVIGNIYESKDLEEV